jgi:hypothetical protein
MTTCERAQVALIDGEADDAVRAHVAGCADCRFFAGLSQLLGPAVPADELAKGEPLLGRYVLHEALGRGGEGAVYRAVDTETQQEVAIKIVRRRGERTDEANARRIRHEHVCRVFHTERHGDLSVIVMELIAGPTLDEALPRLGWRARRRVLREIAEGVAAAHRAGVLHLDLKPRNVMLRDGTSAVVMDFGLSARTGEGAVRARGGTPAFMAPEQKHGGPVDRRADVHALGKLAATLVGEGRIARRATRPDPADRYPDVHALVHDLDRPRRWLVAAAAILVMTAVVALWVGGGRGAARAAGRTGWRADLWGPDTVPPEARNVALDRSGGAAHAVASHPPFACARSLSDLFDGVTQYAQWEHGYAFTVPPDGAPGTCISLANLGELGGEPGQCGALRADAQLCEQGPHDAFRVLPERVSSLASMSTDRQRTLGQWEPDEAPCGERTITVELPREHTVVAVRTWHHERSEVPTRYAVQIPDGTGWRNVFATRESSQAIGKSAYPTGVAGQSAPITADFAPVKTRVVRFMMDTCTTRGALCADDDPPAKAFADRTRCPPGHGWLYELEVFALD